MKDNAMIKIVTVSAPVDGSEGDKFELSTPGKFYIRDGKFYIMYKESEITGFKNTSTTVKIAPDMALLTRHGDFSSRMEFCLMKKRLCRYQTPYGVIPVAVELTDFENNLSERGGDVSLTYNLDFNNEPFAKNSLKLTVEMKG